MSTNVTDIVFIPPGAARRRRRVLLTCVIASLILHVVALAVLPEFKVDPPTAAGRTLEVALVTIEPPRPLPPISSEPQRAPTAATQEKPAVPARKRKEAARSQVPAQQPSTVPEPRPVGESAASPAAPAVEPAEPRRGARPAAMATAPRDSFPQSTPPGLHAEYLRNPAPRYPLIARRNGEQGTVMLRVLVTREGVPVEVSVEKSSGSSHLDSAALEAVKTWRFVPARRGAEAVEAWVLVPVVFRLEGVS